MRVISALTPLVLLGSLTFPSALAGLQDASRAGSRVVLDAHNAYPDSGRHATRLDRALGTGLPVAIEQDLVWRAAGNGEPGRSIVSHGAPFDGTEPGLRDHFFERIRPIVERALASGDTTRWPLITLNLDLKTNEQEHHAAVWALLGDYEEWLTTAVRTERPDRVSALRVRPVLVLTGDSAAQEAAFHDRLPVGASLRVFGAVTLRPPETAPNPNLQTLVALDRVPVATNYRRWWNAPWSVVEAGGQRSAGDWTSDDDQRLRAVSARAHAQGLWLRLWTLNGHTAEAGIEAGWSEGYNVGSAEAAAQRWRAAIAAGVDYVATDQYEAFTLLQRSAVR